MKNDVFNVVVSLVKEDREGIVMNIQFQFKKMEGTYGNGYYMAVKIADDQPHLYDIRYDKDFHPTEEGMKDYIRQFCLDYWSGAYDSYTCVSCDIEKVA